MTCGYSWIMPLNRSWMSQINRAVFVSPRDAMISVNNKVQIGFGNVNRAGDWGCGFTVNLGSKAAARRTLNAAIKGKFAATGMCQ